VLQGTAKYSMDIIGLDLDSVLGNTSFAIDQFIYEKFGVRVDDPECENYMIGRQPYLTEDMQQQVSEAIYSGDLLHKVVAYNYAEHATKKLRNEGFAVSIITSRPSKLRGVTMDWLDDSSIVYDSLYLVDSMKKYKIVKDLGAKAFVDDRFDILESVLENCGPLDYGIYSVFQHWNKKFSNNQIVPVADVAEAVDKIVDFRKWKGYFLTQCAGNIEKFIKEYQDGK